MRVERDHGAPLAGGLRWLATTPVDLYRNGNGTGPRMDHVRTNLGCVDGFNQYQRACKADDGRVADVGLLAAHGDAFEAFELADRLFDAGA